MKLVLTADRRRRTQTFSSADLAEEKQSRPLGNKEKLFDRIYRIVQDLFFFWKALMKNM
jgi:hypothetical protein